MNRRTASLSFSILLVAAMTLWFVTAYHGHEVQPATGADREVSAERAVNALATILGDQAPHPAGSDRNRMVGDRIVETLESMGLAVRETEFEMEGVALRNMMAHIEGDSARRPILLATHYDSVSQGPGAADAGACVAALLDVMRVLKQRQTTTSDGLLQRDVYFLLTDAEEYTPDLDRGLNGATHFAEVERGDVFARNPLVLNFDARGAAGPSLLYETSDKNYALMKQLLPALPRPAFTASSFVAVYSVMPNATDFTIFKRQGLKGVNFAFIDDPHYYHTPSDTIENLDPRSIQHHGNNALALVQSMLETPDDVYSYNESAVFFVLFGHWIVCYPASWALRLATGMLAAQLLATRGALRRGAAAGQMGIAALAVLAAMVTAAIAGFAITIASRYGFLPASRHGFSHFDPWTIAGLWLVAGVAAGFAFRIVSFRTSSESTWNIIWLGWAVAGLASAVALPGISYIPLTVGLIPAILSFTPYDKSGCSVLAVSAAAVVLVPLGYQFGIALGPPMAVALSILYVAMLTPLFPMLACPRARAA